MRLIILLFLASVSFSETVRLEKDHDGRITAFLTPIIHLENSEGIKVDLIGAVHVGDKDYYNLLEERFKTYDALLYELITTDSDLRPSKDADNKIKNILGLYYQLDLIDYNASNFVHADLTKIEFSDSMKERGESFLDMFLKLIFNVEQDDQFGFKMFLSFFSPKKEVLRKRILAEQLVSSDKLLSMFVEDEGSTILTVRNDRAIKVLNDQIKKGKRNLGIFYGAGHLDDLKRKLEDKFYHINTEWLIAWNLTS